MQFDYGYQGISIKVKLRWDSLLPLDQLWAQFNRVLKPNGAAVLTACQPFTTALINSNPRHFKYCWYWRKNMYYTDPGGVVLDACMGSGTTAAACIRTGRSFIGYEIDPKYYALSLERIQKEEFPCQ